MKTLISASILAVSLFAGSAQAADVSNVFTDLNNTAPRSVFTDIANTAPRGLFDQINETAPRGGVFGDLQDTAPRSDGVYGTLENQAP